MAAQVDANLAAQSQNLITLLKEYEWLTNSYMLDFFVCQQLEKMPKSWQKIMQDVDLETVGEFLDFSNVLASKIWPLSLLALRRSLQVASLRRQEITNLTLEKENKKTAWFSLLQEKNLLLKHVKPKKRYEIDKIAAKTAYLASKENVGCVIDIGSGLGHLCRTLSYGYGVKTLAIESQEDLISRAQVFDDELEITAGKHLPASTIVDLKKCSPYHKHLRIESCTASTVLTQLMQEMEEREGRPLNFGIVGLHPCGDLAVTLLRLFIQSPAIRFISIVGCCYHKMTLSGNSSLGFPLSSSTKYNLTSETAALGCHALEAYSARLRRGDYDYLKIHCFRAALEQIIAKHWPQYRHSGLNNVKHYPDLSFPQYCEKAVKKLGLKIPEEDLTSPETLANLGKWKEAAFYHSIMVLLGPAIESLVLLDRLQFLRENGFSSQLYPFFDPAVSARNFILEAVKPTRISPN